MSDKLLKAQDVSIPRLAISWLYFIRPHPQLDTKYDNLFFPWFNYFISLLSLFIKYFIQCIFFLFSSLKFSYKQERKSSNVDCLIVSHLTHPKQFNGQVSDPYCGLIASSIEKKGLKTHTLFINHIARKDIPKNIKKDSVLLSQNLNFLEALKILRNQIFEFFLLISKIREESSSIEKKFILRVAIESLSKATRFNLVLSKNIESYLKYSSVKNVITTFEGHPWERIIYRTARMSNSNILCFGYQHSFIFNEQYSVMRSFGRINDPDYILSSGKISKEKLIRIGDWDKKQVLVIGKLAIKKSKIPKILPNRKKICLVIPEGMESECNILFTFTLQCAKKFPDILFIWRLHPLLNFDSIFTKYPELSKFPSNVRLSTLSFKADVKISRWVIYRGSTAVIEACLNQVIPIFYKNNESDLKIDPLVDLARKRRIVKSESDLKDIFELKERLSLKTFMNLTAYCNDVFTHFKSIELLRVLRID